MRIPPLSARLLLVRGGRGAGSAGPHRHQRSDPPPPQAVLNQEPAARPRGFQGRCVMRIPPLSARLLAVAALLVTPAPWALAQSKGVDPSDPVNQSKTDQSKPADRSNTRQSNPVQPNTVTIDHASGIQNPVATLELGKGDVIHASVINTNLDCFEFSQETKAVESWRGDLAKATRIDYEIIHDGKATQYIIEAKKRANAPADCPNLSERTWEIDVLTLGWAVDFAGAFTIDQLTDPVFRLEQEGTAQSPKFRITRNRGAEDSQKLGAAAMMHLYHTDPDFLGRNDIAWAPLSFGVGVGEDSKTRYFVGTSVRFNTKLFLTAGRVFGAVSRLPNSLQIGGTTDDGKALEGLQSRTADAWFLSLSFPIEGVSLRDSFQKPFQAKKPSATEVATQ